MKSISSTVSNQYRRLAFVLISFLYIQSNDFRFGMDVAYRILSLLIVNHTALLDSSAHQSPFVIQK